ncbi:transposase [Odoribacter sp. OttesenSCG-928-G04]|nr:transposase [Odoribacter sp. OttesenSCG-928-G04]MDL2331308.1 transposase [Odoribacter sp. OttesenSCG-928-A06]
MPRQARIYSEIGLYHIILRGIDRSVLFNSDEDKLFFISRLRIYSSPEFQIHCYCLMDNHVHLLIKSGQVSLFIKRITISYAKYFNHKYLRTGHLFEDRFKSEVIEENNHLIQCIRYILQNPLKAGIISQCAMYKWSSYSSYYSKEPDFIYSDIIKTIFEDILDFREYMNEPSELIFTDVEKNIKLNDFELNKLFRLLLNERNINSLSKMEIRDIIDRMKREVNMTMTQFARVSGLSYGTVKMINKLK